MLHSHTETCQEQKGRDIIMDKDIGEMSPPCQCMTMLVQITGQNKTDKISLMEMISGSNINHLDIVIMNKRISLTLRKADKPKKIVINVGHLSQDRRVLHRGLSYRSETNEDR